MPYRRLPNTDKARVRTLRQAVQMGEQIDDVYHLAFSLKSLTDARNVLPHFEAAQEYYTTCYAKQAAAGVKHRNTVKLARLYISHFVQVLNMAVIRQELKKSVKEYYGLKPDDFTIPDLSSESGIVEWGMKIIKGEQVRTGKGGVPIYNPTIAKVKVHYDIFCKSYEEQKELQAATARSLDAIAAMREGVDEVILDIWNQVEERFANYFPDEVRLDACRQYGVIYYYRNEEISPKRGMA
jgi:hypothetical protein